MDKIMDVPKTEEKILIIKGPTYTVRKKSISIPEKEEDKPPKYSRVLKHIRFPDHLWNSRMVYRGRVVRRMGYPWRNRKIYSDCIIPPVQSWYPSTVKAFNLNTQLEPEAVIRFLPFELNPAIWYNVKRCCLAVVFPKNVKRLATVFMKRYFRYEPRTDMWLVRYRRNRKNPMRWALKELRKVPVYDHPKLMRHMAPKEGVELDEAGRIKPPIKRIVFRKSDAGSQGPAVSVVFKEAEEDMAKKKTKDKSYVYTEAPGVQVTRVNIEKGGKGNAQRKKEKR